MNDSPVPAAILAGGSGSRLWPLSRQHLPKQFLSLDGEASLLQTTINRLPPVIDAGNALIVTQEFMPCYLPKPCLSLSGAIWHQRSLTWLRMGQAPLWSYCLQIISSRTKCVFVRI